MQILQDQDGGTGTRQSVQQRHHALVQRQDATRSGRSSVIALQPWHQPRQRRGRSPEQVSQPCLPMGQPQPAQRPHQGQERHRCLPQRHARTVNDRHRVHPGEKLRHEPCLSASRLTGHDGDPRLP